MCMNSLEYLVLVLRLESEAQQREKVHNKVVGSTTMALKLMYTGREHAIAIIEILMHIYQTLQSNSVYQLMNRHPTAFDVAFYYRLLLSPQKTYLKIHSSIHYGGLIR